MTSLDDTHRNYESISGTGHGGSVGFFYVGCSSNGASGEKSDNDDFFAFC